MSEFRADLHIHSTFSDGTLDPETLIVRAKDAGLQGLSITDHDTIAAYPEAFLYAEKAGLLLLPGAEFSSVHNEEPVHVLAYGFPINSPEIKALVDLQIDFRKERNVCILENLKKMFGFEITLEKKEIGSLGRPHIARALMERGIVSSIKEAFDKYLGEGKKAWAPGTKLTVEEVIAWIQKARGKAILAHPHLINRRKVLRELLKMPFDGIECYYANFLLHEAKRFLEIASEKKWIVSGGSDFHGDNKPYSRIGSSFIGKETFLFLYDHFQAASKTL